MLAIKLDADTENLLDIFSKKMGKTKNELGSEAIQRLVEDLQDYFIAEERMKNDDPSKRISLEQMKAELGMDD